MGRDYPKTQVEFEQRFATEEACRGYIAQLRWPDRFVCPRCQAKSARSATRQ
ncbi:MAG: transposase, partial [Bryobacterales bacterium]|nr:transposase [Bryobacterales bacterium]